MDFNDLTSYRNGEVRGEETWTPRLVSVDEKGSRGTLALDGGELYRVDLDPDEDRDRDTQRFWNGPFQKVEMEQIKKNAFLSSLDDLTANRESHSPHLTETVRYWSDFNSAYYHPHSLLELNQYVAGDETNQFRFYNQGKEVFSDGEFQDDLMDSRIRKFMEECDSAQGFQILVDADSGFSGLGSSVVEELRQNYDKKTILVFSLANASRATSRLARVNRALLMKSMQENNVLYVPLHTPCPDDLNPAGWSSLLSPSGYLCSAIESITLPTRYALPSHSRLKATTQKRDLAELQDLMDYQGSSTAALALGLPPLPAKKQGEFSLPQTSQGAWSWSRDLSMELDSANIKHSVNSYSVFRGIEKVLSTQLLGPNEVYGARSLIVAMRIPAASCLPSLAICPACRPRQRGSQSLLIASLIYDTPFPVTASFPQYFGPRFTREGLVATTDQHQQVDQAALVATLHNGPQLKPLFHAMIKNITFRSQDDVLVTDCAMGDYGTDPMEWPEIREHFRVLVDDDDASLQ
ncbi:mtDNA inheritance, partitioning of the mitochondrial organelle [Kappamyces sp. JEL0680]|nr:mtDNA inheritance, partitioning of the mitochondrial organelle [Kappamyces sp. JEL0680]